MNIYIDLINRRAVTSPTDSTPAVRPDFSAATTYPINLYFLRGQQNNYTYARFPNSVIVLSLRSVAPVEVARFTLIFRGAETSEIDTRFSMDQITKLLEALPTVGKGNVSVAMPDGKLTIEFVGDLAGTVLPTMSARVVSSTPADAELTIEVLPVTANEANSRQQLSLRRAALAQQSTWTEVTIGTTPGWTGTLDTTTVPVSVWDNPVGDILLEVKLTALSVRSASDGATSADTTARSGADGQVIMSPGASGTANIADNGDDSFLIAADGGGVYGRKFVQGDVGREVVDVVDDFVWQYTTIVEVTDDGITNMARLSQRLKPEGIGLGVTVDYTLTPLPSDVYYSATANFTAADVGHVIIGANIPTNTRIMSIINTQYVRLSQRATAVGITLPWSIASEVSNVFTSGAGVFQSGDVGATIRAPAVLDGEAKITKFISATQVELDRQPKATATGISWKVIPVRSYPPALVTRVAAGNTSVSEIQKIALAQTAVGGVLTIQDGYGGAMPVITLPNPVSTSELEIALTNTYMNYGSCKAVEVIPGVEWDVTFGTKGNQRLLLVSEASATYEDALLQWIVADKAAAEAPQTPAIPELPEVAPLVTRLYGLIYIGADPAHPEYKIQVGVTEITRMTDGTNAYILKRRMREYADRHVPLAMNATLISGNITFYFVGEEGGEQRNGIYTYTQIFAQIPTTRTEYHNHARPYIFPARTYSGGTLIDIQLVSVTVSQGVNIEYKYYKQGNEPPEPGYGPAGVVVHFAAAPGGGSGTQKLIQLSNFDSIWGTWGTPENWSWTRRRWMGHIWEQQKVYDTGTGVQRHNY